jgi:hypothetical protein
MIWSIFEREAPELAARVRARFEAHAHHVLATLRTSGAPRVSGSNVEFIGGELTVGSMPGAVKALDLRRDGRFALHSAPLDEKLVGGDAKLSGTAVLLEGDALKSWGDGIEAATGNRPSGDSDAFRLEITEASLVEVDGDHLVITSWRPGGPAQSRTRS